MIVGLKGTKGWAEVQRGSTLTEGAIKQQRILLTKQQAKKKVPGNAWGQLEKGGRILMRIT